MSHFTCSEIIKTQPNISFYMLSLSCREIKQNLCTLEPLSHSAGLLFIPVYPWPLLRKQSYLGFCVNLRPVRVLVDSISSTPEKARELFLLLLLLLPHRALWSSSARSGSRLGQTAAERWITKSSPNLFRSTGFGAGVIWCLFFWGLGLYFFFYFLVFLQFNHGDSQRSPCAAMRFPGWDASAEPRKQVCG